MGARSHRTRWSSSRKPHFFKVLLGDFRHRLKIPPNFMKHIAEETSQKAILQGPSGHNWQVELTKTVEGVFLSAGWPSFVKHHLLRKHEFLVFRYDGNMHFSVMIFDKTACEREEFPVIRRRKKSLLSEREKNKIIMIKQPSGISFIAQDQSRKCEMLKLHPEDEYASDESQGRSTSSTEVSGNANIKIEEDELPISMTRPYISSKKVVISRRRSVTEEERLEAQAAAESFSSVFPFVIIRMTVTNCYLTHVLRFPVAFSRTHLPRKRINMVLRDPNRKAWIVVYIPGKRDLFSAGWNAFVRGNNLEEGDFCVFELTQPAEMRVHIFRVVQEITPVVRMARKGP